MGAFGSGIEQNGSIKWPLIKPKNNLHFTSLKTNEIIAVPNFLTSTESKAYIEAAESIGFTQQASHGPTKGEAYRNSERISMNDPFLADLVWKSGLQHFFAHININGQVAVGLNPNMRFYRYTPGQFFEPHYDASVNLGEGKRTLYTVLIYLNGKSNTNPAGDDVQALVGGETVFYGLANELEAEVAPEEGKALLHLHGDERYFHESRNVTQGVKYVLRSDVIFSLPI